MRFPILVQQSHNVVFDVDGLRERINELLRAGGGFDGVVVVVQFDFLDGVEAVAGGEPVDADADAGLGLVEEESGAQGEEVGGLHDGSLM